MPSDKIKNTYNPAPQGDSSPTPSNKQPPQGSQRRPRAHEHEPEEREDPKRQGTPGPRSASSPSEQGAAGGGGARGVRSDDVEEIATSGEPRSEHTRRGRQKTPPKRG